MLCLLSNEGCSGPISEQVVPYIRGTGHGGAIEQTSGWAAVAQRQSVQGRMAWEREGGVGTRSGSELDGHRTWS